jgi:hypothetical protein
VPQKNVLIIQEDTVEEPAASLEGGMMFFDFVQEAEIVYEIGLMNIQGGDSYITVVYREGDIQVVKKIDVVG